MLAIARSQVNTQNQLVWVGVDADGWLYAPAVLEFQIWDETGASPVRIFPAVIPAPGVDVPWHALLSTDAVSTGFYYARTSGGAGWTPSASANLGKWRINWRWKVATTDAYQTSTHRFNMLALSHAFDRQTYLDLQDIRDEGLTTSDVSDARAARLLPFLRDIVEEHCGRRFYPRDLTIRRDGNAGLTMFLPEPIVGMREILYGSAQTVFDPTYVVLNYVREGNERKAYRLPTVSLMTDDASGDIFTRLDSDVSGWAQGTDNHRFSGVFGCVDAQHECPALVREAMLRMLVLYAPTLVVGGDGAVRTEGIVSSETVDKHRVSFASNPKPFTSIHKLLRDAAVAEMLAPFRAPNFVHLSSGGTNR